jgi:hypothetical protein
MLFQLIFKPSVFLRSSSASRSVSSMARRCRSLLTYGLAFSKVSVSGRARKVMRRMTQSLPYSSGAGMVGEPSGLTSYFCASAVTSG